jgi:invasion protein IalB
MMPAINGVFASSTSGFIMVKFLPLAALLLAMVPSSAVLAQDAASALPGGATSLQETYKDWRVACTAPEGQAKQCAVSQQQAQENGQRVLAIELATAANGSVIGTLVLPFGLRLDAGVALAVDQQTAQSPLRFSTCLPAGCLVPLNFDQTAIAALRGGTALKLKAMSNDGQDVALSISLSGFSTALDRLVALTAV